jgi:hypothetical protein
MFFADCSFPPPFQRSHKLLVHVYLAKGTRSLEPRYSRYTRYFGNLLKDFDFALFEVDAIPGQAERLAQAQAAFQA